MNTLAFIFMVLMYLFQIWMLIDAIRRQEWIWAILMGCALFLWQSYGLGAILYYFLVYRPQAGSHSSVQFEIPGLHTRRRIRELESQIHHLDNAHHHLELGNIYFEQGKIEKAESCYRDALKRDESDPDIKARLGQCLLHQGRAEEALPFLQSVANEDRHHDYGNTLMSLAETHMQLGSEDTALQLWEIAVEHNAYARAKVQLAELLIKKGQEERARAILEETIADEEHAPAFQRRKDRVWMNRARTLLRGLNAT